MNRHSVVLIGWSSLRASRFALNLAYLSEDAGDTTSVLCALTRDSGCFELYTLPDFVLLFRGKDAVSGPLLLSNSLQEKVEAQEQVPDDLPRVSLPILMHPLSRSLPLSCVLRGEIPTSNLYTGFYSMSFSSAARANPVLLLMTGSGCSSSRGRTVF